MPDPKNYSKFLIKNVTYLMIVRIFVTALSIFTLPLITAYLTPDEFGIIALFLVEASLFSSLFSLGLGSFAGRMVLKFERRKAGIYKMYMGVMLFYICLFSGIGSVLTIPFLLPIKELIFKDIVFPNKFLLFVPLITAYFTTIKGYSINALLNLQLNKQFAICEGLSTFLVVIPQVIGLVWFNFGWVEVVLLNMWVNIFIGFLSLWMIRNHIGFSIKRLKIIKIALAYSLPYVPMSFTSWIHQYVDRIFLGNMVGVASVGIYSIAAKFSNMFGFFSRPLMSTIKPEISKRLDARDSKIQNDIGDFFTLFFQFSLFCMFIFSIFAKEIVIVFTDKNFQGAYLVVPFLLFAVMFSEIVGVFHLKFIYKNKTILFPVVTFVGVILNVVFNLILIPKFQILGAAFATFVSEFSMLLVCYFLSQRLHRSEYNLFKNLIVCASVIFIILIVYQIPMSLLIGSIIKALLVGIYGIVLYFYLSAKNTRFIEVKNKCLVYLRARFDCKFL